MASAVRLAVRAPSIHNTQPWRWVLAGDTLELHADHDRQLAAVDPDGRGLLLSCGGALYLAQLGLAGRGWRTEVQRLPEPDLPDLLARIRATGRGPVGERTRALIVAAEQRRTDRRPFQPDPVPPELLEQLRGSAPEPGAYIHVVESADERLNLAVAMSWADRVEAEDDAVRAELAHWLRPEAVAAGEGIPPSAVPHVPAGSPRHTEVPVRDFEVGRTGTQQIPAGLDEQPAYLVVFSTDDDRSARLRAGEVYVRLSVEITRLGLASSAMTQGVDLPGVRSRLRGLMNWPDIPQMVLRLGWPPAGDAPPPTPRRSASAVLTVEDDDTEPAAESGADEPTDEPAADESAEAAADGAGWAGDDTP